MKKIKQLLAMIRKIYDKPVSKKPAKDKFIKLSLEDCKKCVEVVSAYVKSTPDKTFRKHVSTWLNQECWNDEVEVVSEGITGGKLKGMIL